ncbi:MAG: single-stranded DNA-binding protein [Candidatus Omnitrophica bacterium]|nr:single-stranded DNA-binding protein [Candidatus Omnitrophota bacterium]
MANFNKVLFMGNLTRDPELRYLPNGTAVATFSVASNRVYKLPTGEKKEEATFIRVVVWSKRAEICAEYLAKGSSVFVEGRLQSRTWQGQDGQKRSTIEIIADNVQFIGKPKKDIQAGHAAARQGSQEPLDSPPDVDISADEKSPGTGEDDIPF